MTTSHSLSALRGMAHAFLALRGPVAIEPAAGVGLNALVRQFAMGSLSADDLRAALAVSSQTTRPTSALKSVALLTLQGVLEPHFGLFCQLGLGTSIRAFTQQLTAAAADPSIKGIGIAVDSPGGHVAMIPEAADAMRKARAKKPVTASVLGLNASAAYWITANASHLSATPSARIGSIGVFTQRASIVGMLEQAGVAVETISAGQYKSEGLPETTMSDEERRALQASVDEVYTSFVEDVGLGRGVPVARVRTGFGEGRLIGARQALALGMIDKVESAEDTIGRLARGQAAMARTPSGQLRGDDDRQRVAIERLRL